MIAAIAIRVDSQYACHGYLRHFEIVDATDSGTADVSSGRHRGEPAVKRSRVEV
jgi:hypothetical protein